MTTRFFNKLLATAALIFCSQAAMADAYPSRLVTLVVPFPAGGALDAVARPLAEEMRKVLGQSVIVDNRAGAGGTVGTASVARAAPDGYTILLGSVATHAIASGVYPKLQYDPVGDFAPIMQVTRSPLVIAAGPKSSATDLAQLVKDAKARPGALNYASTGNGTALHIAGELFKSAAGIDVLHVPYRGGGQATTALLGGEVDYMLANAPLVLQHIRAGKVRALAVTGDKRLPALPDVPTLAEARIADAEVTTWFGLFAPAGTPRDVVARLNAAAAKALMVDSVAQQVAVLGEEPVGNSAEEFTRFVRSEHKRWVDIVRAARIKIE